MEEEVWKDYDEKYKVSSLGKVWNKLNDKECKIYINKVGYCRVSIHGKGMGLHRIVALTFLDNPENKPTVNHKNAIKSDNRLDNLEWATYKEQSQHVSENRLHPDSLQCCILDENNNITKIYPSQKSLGTEMKLRTSYIRNMCIGNTDKVNNVRVRYYNELDNTYIKTRYDNNEVRLKGQYRKKIYCKTTNKTYDTQMECAKDLKEHQSLISKILLGKVNNSLNIYYL